MSENKALYTLEGIACILVIFIHCGFPGYLGNLMETIARISVPIFFMISGYFNLNASNDKIKDRIKKQIKIFFVAYLIYFIYCNFENIVLNGTNTMAEYNKEVFSLEYIIDFVFFNRLHIIGTHLWFIIGLIYCYITKLAFNDNEKKGKYVIFIIIIPIFKYILELLMIIDSGYESTILRNWLFVGLPFFYLGEYIRKNEKEIINVSNKKIILLAIISFIGLFIERIAFKILFDDRLQVFISTYFLCYYLFIFCIKNKEYNINSFYIFGKNYALMIYLSHNIFNYFLRNIIIKKLGFEINGYLLPILVVFLTSVFSIIMKYLSSKKKIYKV